MSGVRARVSRRLAAGLGVAVATVVLLEIASLALFSTLAGRPFERSAIERERAERRRAIASRLEQREGWDTPLMMHPYVGYAGRPGALHPTYVGPKGRVPFDALGMLAPLAPDPRESEKRPLRIAVLGGSVAEMFAVTQAPSLARHLRRLQGPGFDRPVELVVLAAGGYKQPQQLFLLEYALLLGMQFDAVVNIDGFNDLVLAVENHAAGVHPIYPSAFHVGALVQAPGTGPTDPGVAARLDAFHATLASEQRVLAWVEDTPLRWSPFANLAAEVWSRRAAARVSQIRFHSAEAAGGSVPPELRGPRRPWPRDAARAAARIWRNASRMIAAVCADAGIPYLHLLQPNQYVEGSKPLSAEERRVAYRPDHDWARHAREGYPLLRAMGPQLRSQGVAFYDLTMIFRDRSETIYTDDCCHFGALGNDILAAAVAQALTKELGSSLVASD